VVKRFLEAGYMDRNVFNETDEGTPQGGLLSPLLANIALHGMEKALGISYKTVHGTTKRGKPISYTNAKGKYRLVRFADDFVIFAQSKEDIMKVYEILKPYLNERGLVLAEDKTKITHLSHGFDFLGFHCRRYKDNISRIKPSKESIKKLKLKISDTFKECYGNNVETLIQKLNPIINGAARYWCHSVIYDIFPNIDKYIWIRTSKFLRRLHPNKSWKWLINRYFPYFKDKYGHESKWVLTDPKTGKFLMKMYWYKYKSYIMVKHDYSPYDRNKVDYFENRKVNYHF
jgi:RNA-directed DNA polymerase